MATITRATLAEQLVDTLNFDKKMAAAFVDRFFSKMIESLAEGKMLKFSSFGTFLLRDKRARPGRNPKTGESVTVSPRRVVTFKAGKKLRREIAPLDASVSNNDE